MIGILRPVPLAPEIDKAATGLGVALVTGILAGMYPAARAARLAPAEALRAV